MQKLKKLASLILSLSLFLALTACEMSTDNAGNTRPQTQLEDLAV